jgi:hypothetical protein
MIRVGIEGNIDTTILGQMFNEAGIGRETDNAAGGDGTLGEEGSQAAAGLRIGKAMGFDYQVRIGNAVEQIGPEFHQGGIDFGVIIEAAEGDVAGGLERRRLNVGSFDGGTITEKTIGEPQEPLGMKGIGKPGGIGMGVGNAIIHRGQAGGVGIAEIGHLNGCGLAEEDGEAVVAGVTAEIDKNIDAIVADDLGKLVIGDSQRVSPAIGLFAEILGVGVGAFDVAITGDVELPAVAQFEE